MNSADLLHALKRHFGFSAFRPLQEAIVRDVLSGRDVFALLPTGGGKSLCYQLPAVLRDGLTLVVSPLIALMKDQVDALQAAGISATYLNSSLSSSESSQRLRGLRHGNYKLLYLAPERLMVPGFLQILAGWGVRVIAIDEAHCISEWGHDFRPEYRQLAQLRREFPDAPFLALTATATPRVKQDVLEQLALREPSIYVASFNRPNLHYQVLPKQSAAKQVLAYLGTRPGQSGIIYCQSRQSAERVAERLAAHGFKAAAYHAGLTGSERAARQEQFLRDDLQIICATIAFGMGINKPNVRFVIHYDLPKNIEGYYQETGRAGRDGLRSDCLLLFSPGDVIKQSGFIDEKSPAEQQLARQQLQQIVHFAESCRCRRAVLLEYFGEPWNEPSCGACDNCLFPRATFDGTIPAQKFLSSVYRIAQRHHFGVGLNHIAEILTGADTEKIRRWKHHELSTYGIGREHSREEWQAMGRELVRLGYLAQTTDKFTVLQLTPAGRQVLQQRTPITLTLPRAPAAETKLRERPVAFDEGLFERLRTLRKRLADAQQVPPYIIFSDVSLQQMARSYPASESDFARISGVGEKKKKAYASIFLEVIAEHLKTNARQMFAGDAF